MAETKAVLCKVPSGEEYRGEWADGKPNGFGKIIFPNMDVYEGGWKDGLMDGQGVYRFYDEKQDSYTSSYEGDFVEGKRHGVGRITFVDHTSYIGQWQNDERVGDGFACFPDGTSFHGLWQHNQMMRGVFALANGDRYDGEIKEGRFCGYGKYFWTDGKWFEGIWLDGKMNKGKIFFPDGHLSEIEDGKEI